MRNINILYTTIFTTLLALVLTFFVTAESFAAQDNTANSDKTIELESRSDSGISGVAKLKPEGNKTTVFVLLEGAADGVTQPIHIHKGSCDDLGPPKYPLNPVKEGQSRTTVDASLEELLSGDLAINAHKSKQEIQEYVACGNLK